MSFRFRRTQSLLGNLVRLNLGAQSASVSIGVPGARVTVPLWGQSRARGTVGIPGTGMFYSKELNDKK